MTVPAGPELHARALEIKDRINACAKPVDLTRLLNATAAEMTDWKAAGGDHHTMAIQIRNLAKLKWRLLHE